MRSLERCGRKVRDAPVRRRRRTSHQGLGGKIFAACGEEQAEVVGPPGMTALVGAPEGLNVLEVRRRYPGVAAESPRDALDDAGIRSRSVCTLPPDLAPRPTRATVGSLASSPAPTDVRPGYRCGMPACSITFIDGNTADVEGELEGGDRRAAQRREPP